MWKGFKDLYSIGFIDRLPRLISVQAEGCCPINTAVAENKALIPCAENTIADSIAVGVPRNSDKAIAAIRESKGITVNVTDEEILSAILSLGQTCGVFAEPAGAAGTAGVKKALEQGFIERDASVCSIVTGNGLKDIANGQKAAGQPMHLPPDLSAFDRALIDKNIQP